MKQIPKISEAEYEVMKTVWGKNPISANEIVEELSDKTDWQPKTVKTLINRLLKKDALGFTLEKKTYLYYPAVSKDDCIKEESESFLNKIFDGALMPMLTHFAKSRNLSVEDIEKLKSILNEEKGK